MASDAEIKALGFILPSGSDPISLGDDAIAANARRAVDEIRMAESRATDAAVAVGKKAATDLAATDQAVRAFATSQIRAHIDTSHVALDTDGTPFWSAGSTAVRVLPDEDGIPYFTPINA